MCVCLICAQYGEEVARCSVLSVKQAASSRDHG